VRRVRGTSGVVIADATRRRSGQISIEVPEQIAVDPDVRKLLDAIRNELGDALRGRSTPQLERTWSLAPIVGSEALASTAIELSSNGGDAYLFRVFDIREAEVVPAVINDWAKKSAPESDGVGTEETVDTSGGQIPRR